MSEILNTLNVEQIVARAGDRSLLSGDVRQLADSHEALRSELATRTAERDALQEELDEASAEVQRLCLILAVESDDAFDVPFTDAQKAELAVDYDEWIADRKQRAEDAEVGKQIRLAQLRPRVTGTQEG